MATLSSLIVRIGATTSGLQRGLKNAQNSVKRAGKRMKSAGRTLTKGLTLPLAAVGATAVTTAAKHNKSMQEIQAQAGLTANQMDDVTQAMDDVRTTTGKSTQDVQEAMTLAQSSALDMAEANELVKTSAKASASGFGEMRNMINFATTASNKFGDDVDSAAGALETVIGTADQVQAQMDQFIPAMLKGTAGMQQLNISMDEGAALFGKLADSARNTRAAGTQYAALLKQLNSPQKDLKNLLENTFGSMEQFREAMGRNSVQALNQFKSAVDDSNKNMAQLLGRQRAVSGASNLFAGSMDRVNEIMQKQASRQDLIQKKFEKTSNIIRTAKITWEELKIAIRPIGKIIINELQPAIGGVIGQIRELSNHFKNLSPQTQRYIVLAGALAAVLGPVIFAIGTFLTMTSSLIGVISGVIGVISSFVTGILSVVNAVALMTPMLSFFVAWSVLLSSTIASLILLVEAIRRPAETAGFLGKALAKLVDWFDKLGINIRPVVRGLLDMAVEANKLVRDFVNETIRRFKKLAEAGAKVNKLFSSIYHSAKKWIVDKFMGIINTLKKWKDKIVGVFSSMNYAIVGNSIVPEMVEDVVGQYEILRTDTTDIMRDTKNKTEKSFMNIQKSGRGVFSNIKRFANRNLKAIAKGHKDLEQVGKDVFNKLKNKAIDAFTEILFNFKQTERSGRGLTTRLKGSFQGLYELMKTGAKKVASTFKSVWQKAGNAVLSILKKIASQDAFGAIGSVVSGITSVLTGGISSLAGGLLGGGGGGLLGGLLGGGGGLLGGLFGGGGVGSMFAGFFQSGGTVPGRRGEPKLAVVHGQEEIIPPEDQVMFGGGGSKINGMNAQQLEIRVDGDRAGEEIFQKLVEEFRLRTPTKS